MKNGKLKKLITLATVVASTFALVACGSSSSDDSKGSDSSAKKDSGTVYRTLDEIKKDGTINIGVFSDKNPFGYVDENVNALTIDGVELNAENVKNDSYAIARPFLFVNKEDVITEQGKNFIDFILSEEGQNVVEENGFISVN